MAVGNSGLAIRYASEQLRRDVEVAATAMLEDQRALSFVAQELWVNCFEEAQKISSKRLQRLEKQENGLQSGVRLVPCCLGGLAGCLVGPVLATGLALKASVACLASGTAGVLLGLRALDSAPH